MRILFVLACSLLVLSCRKPPGNSSQPAIVVAETAWQTSKISKESAIAVASMEAVKLNLGPNFLAGMTIEASLSAEGWNVVFAPKRQPIHGGGVRVLIDKETGLVVKTVIGQ